MATKSTPELRRMAALYVEPAEILSQAGWDGVFSAAFQTQATLLKLRQWFKDWIDAAIRVDKAGALRDLSDSAVAAFNCNQMRTFYEKLKMWRGSRVKRKPKVFFRPVPMLLDEQNHDC